MKKLIITNCILTFSLTSVFVSGYYLILYPDDFNLIRYSKDAEWQSYGLAFLGLLTGAFVLSFLPIKKYNQITRVAIFFAILQSVFLLVLVFKMGFTYKNNRNDLANLMAQYRIKAIADIRKGFIEVEYTGGLELPSGPELNISAEIDSVRRLYGYSLRNSGCIVSAALIKSQEEYKRLTRAYLNNRNGPGWEQKMEQEIQEVRSRYR